MLFTEYLRFTAMTNNKDCTVFSLIARSLFMTTRTYERNRVRTRLQNSTSFPHDTQRVVFNSLHWWGWEIPHRRKVIFCA